MALSSGEKLGPYEILALIGAGGMGEVYKARDTRLNRIVAIKRLKDQHSARFDQEARAIAALNHQNICQIYDVGEDYLVMEFVEGTAVQGPLLVDDAVRLALQVAAALQEAHAAGILHRDLKPGNILVSKKGGIKLLDFGLAKLTMNSGTDETQTVEGTVIGTAAYMSPEQAQGKALDVRSDVFSFGAVLYELLSGVRAFSGNSMLDTLNAVVRNDPPSLQGPAGAVSMIVKRCLAKQPSQRFQNMAEVVAALQLLSVKPVEAQPSVAVLPFANMSRDADDEYFSDGLAEEVINALASVPGLKVIARTSAFAFKGQNTDVRKIAEILGVTNVLEGSVRRAGNRIRVTAQLITAADGTHLWSQRYDRELTDVFAIQDEIAMAIAGALQLKLSPANSPRHVPTLAAYEAYLKYRYYQWRFTPEASKRSRECLEQALALDPRFTLPYVGLADYHLALASVGGVTAEDSMPRARELAQRALELDPELPEAHAMLGIVAGHYDFDWKECGRRFELAMAREPISAHLRQWYAIFFLLAMHRNEEARQQVDRVIEQDPLCQMWHYTMGLVLSSLGSSVQALAAGRKAVELDPQFWLGWWSLGMLHAAQGQHAEMRDCALKASAGAPWSPFSIGLSAAAFASAGESREAQALLGKLSDDAYRKPIGVFCYEFARGEIGAAVDALSQIAENRSPGIIVTIVRPLEPQLRHAAAWPAVLQKLNLGDWS